MPTERVELGPKFGDRIEYFSDKINRRFIIRPFRNEDSEAVIDILNYFFDHSFAAFPDHRVDYDFIEFIKLSVMDFPFFFIETDRGENAGFGYMHPYDYSNVFDRVGELTIFILPHFGGNGLGTVLLEVFTEKARERNIESLLSCISAVNEDSIGFHIAHGFEECGRFRRIGLKKGQVFDIVWVQKFV
ncbi:MAG: N-acetyltransferase family protein [Candidatus Zixiibacteriota bacterium]